MRAVLVQARQLAPLNLAAMTTDQQTPDDGDLLARGGGNATAGGVSFQTSVGAVFAVQLLTERNVDDRLRLGCRACPVNPLRNRGPARRYSC